MTLYKRTIFHRHTAQIANKKKAALAKLKEAQATDDRERAHRDADEVLCDLLKALGMADIVAEYDKIAKWYA
jgi:hypothetical protein